jgi:hypothetical protein
MNKPQEPANPDTVTGFTAQYITLAMALSIAMNEYLEEYDRLSREGPLDPESCSGPEPRRITIVVLGAALCESTINTYLSLKLDPACWGVLGRTSTVEKWTTVPKLFLRDYSIPADSPLHGDLKDLFECRNSIMHSKPEVYEGKKKRHKGNGRAWRVSDDAWVNRTYDLVLRLLEHLAKFDRSGAMTHYSSIQPYLSIPKWRSCPAAARTET